MVTPGAGQGRELHVRDTPLVTMLNSAVCFIAAASAVVGGVSWLLTFTPWTQFMSSGYSIPFFYLTFPLFGWSVVVLTFVRRPDRDQRLPVSLVKELPRGFRIPFVLLFVAVWATGLAAITSLHGQPEYEPGLRRYVYDDHGVLIPATRAAYLHAVVVQNRLFLGVAMLFTFVAVAVTWDERSRRRRDVVTPRRWRHPVKPRPKIPLPAAVLALAAAAGLAVSIATASLIIGRVDAYNGGAIYLRAGHPVRALLAPGHYLIFVGCTGDITCPRLPSSALSATVVPGGGLAVIPDPSSDRLSEAAQPFRGELSFTVPRKETVSLDLAVPLGQPAFAVPSPGEEAHALIGWIVLAGLPLIVVLAALTALVWLLAWRLGFGLPVRSASR